MDNNQANKKMDNSQDKKKIEERKCHEMEEVGRSRSYYEDIKQTPRNKNKFPNISFNQNVSVPNFFRTSDLEMSFWITEVLKNKKLTCRHLVYHDIPGVWEIHIASGGIVISDGDRKNEKVLQERTSWKIQNHNWKGVLRPLGENALIAWEFRKTPQHNYNPRIFKADFQIENATYSPTKDDIKNKRSFLKKALSLAEIRKKIIFLDAEFTSLNVDFPRSPVSVSIIDYHGETVFDTLITPRTRVRDFGTKYHGLKEKHTRGHMDEYDCLRKIHELIRGMILVGHDLRMEIDNLCIDINQILGIRDLSNAKIFEQLGIKKKNDGQWYSLKALAKQVCNKDVQQGIHTAFEDASTVREIYLTVEEQWIDHIDLQPQTKKRITVGEYHQRKQEAEREAISDRTVINKEIGNNLQIIIRTEGLFKSMDTEKPSTSKWPVGSRKRPYDLDKEWDSPECCILEESSPMSVKGSTEYVEKLFEDDDDIILFDSLDSEEIIISNSEERRTETENENEGISRRHDQETQIETDTFVELPETSIVPNVSIKMEQESQTETDPVMDLAKSILDRRMCIMGRNYAIKKVKLLLETLENTENPMAASFELDIEENKKRTEENS